MADIESTRSPAFQFYPANFTIGTLQLTTEEVGAYILLMCDCWDKGSLPTDLTQLARVARLSLTRMRRAWIALESKFILRDDTYVQPRLEREREKQSFYRQQQRERGRLGGRPQKPPLSTEKANGFQNQKPNESQGKALGDGNPDESSSSSVFGLQTSVILPERAPGELARTPARGIGSGVMAGSLQRDHLRHAWCGRVCVPDFLHGRFVGAIGTTDPEASLRAFYRSTLAAISESAPVESDPVKFWPPRVSAQWPGESSVEGSRTAALRRASEEFLKS